MKSKFQISNSILRSESTEGDNGGGATPDVAIDFPTAELTVPTGYVKLEESQDTEASVVSIEAKVNPSGKPFLHLVLQLAEGRTTHKMWVNTPKAAANTLNQLGRAFGVKAFADIQTIVDQKCSISSRFDDFSQRIAVAYINKFNTHSKDVVDLSSLDALAAEAPIPETSMASIEF